jgi:hypothetical protein
MSSIMKGSPNRRGGAILWELAEGLVEKASVSDTVEMSVINQL